MSDATSGTQVVVEESDVAGFHSVLGYRQTDWEDGRSVLTVELQPHHMNLAGVIHGGVLSSLLDIAMAQAGTYCPYPGRMRKALTPVAHHNVHRPVPRRSSPLLASSGPAAAASSTPRVRFMMPRDSCWPWARVYSGSVPAAKGLKAFRFPARRRPVRKGVRPLGRQYTTTKRHNDV